MKRSWAAIVSIGVATAACGNHASSAGPADATTAETSAPDAPLPDGAAADAGVDTSPPPFDGGCLRTAAAADRDRKIVVSHPFDAHGNPSPDYEVFDLATDGTITQTGKHFAMHAASEGRITFTPDGQVGMVAQDDGTIGVFTLDATGTPHVVNAAFSPTYVTAIVMDPSGARAFALNDDWRNSGGGVYGVTLACDGTPSTEGLLVAAMLPVGLVPRDGGTALVGASDYGLFATDAGADAAPQALLVPFPPREKVIAMANPFSDSLAILSDVAVTADGRYGLLADDNTFSNTGTRVGVVDLSAESVAPVQVLSSVNDPQSIVTSPFDDTAIVTSGMGNAVIVLSYGSGAKPYTAKPLVYKGTAPQLPGAAVMVRVGALAGLVLVSEDLGVRRVQFASAGVVTDLGLTSFGGASTDIVGAVGVQP